MTSTNIKPQKYADNAMVLRCVNVQEHEKMSEVMATQNNQRRKLLENECGRDFTILGPNNMKWHISVHLITAYSNVIKRAYLESNPHISTFSLTTYKPLYIDAMTKMAYLGIYSFNTPLAYKVVANAAAYNATPHPDNSTPLVLLHLGVYSLAKNIEYEDLASIALHRMHQCLMADPPLPFSTFLTLKSKVWEQNVDIKDNDIRNLRAEGETLAVRKLLATYAVGWDAVWEKKYRNLWEMHVKGRGSRDGFAFWLRKAGKAVEREARRVWRAQEVEVEESEVEESDDEDGSASGREIPDSEMEESDVDEDSESESDV